MKLILISIFVIAVIGCGDGGSELPNKLFSKINATLGEANIENARQIGKIISKNQEEVFDFRVSVGNRNIQNISFIANQKESILKRNISLNINYYSLSVGEKKACDDGGYRTIESHEQAYDGESITIYFDNCESHNKIVDGKVFIKIYGVEYGLSGFKYQDTIFISDFYITAKKVKTKIFKDSSLKMELIKSSYGNRNVFKKLIINAITQVGNIKTAQENSVYLIEAFSVLQRKGRIYINNLKSYADYDISYNGDKYTPNYTGRGKAIYNMANGGKIKFDVGTIYIDKNNDGIYELEADESL